MAVSISTFSMSQMTIGETCEFHQNVQTLINAATPAALHIEPLIASYEESINQLQSIVNRKRAFVNTIVLKEADDARDSLCGVISSVVRDYLTTTVAEKKQAARVLHPALLPYKGIRAHKYNKETAEIKGMLLELSKSENAAALAVLGLAPEVEALQQANTVFTDALMDRVDEDDERTDVVNIDSRELISTINSQYTTICTFVQVYSVSEPSPAITNFASKLNALVRQFAASLDGSASAGSTPSEPSEPSTPAEGEDNGTEQPSTPSEPSEPSEPSTPSDPSDDDDNNPGGDDPGTGGFMG